jgi:hypothetical protein
MKGKAAAMPMPLPTNVRRVTLRDIATSLGSPERQCGMPPEVLRLPVRLGRDILLE